MTVILSLEDDEGLRCVDIIEGEEGTFTFKEFRRDVEDRRWYLVADFSNVRHTTKEAAIADAVRTVRWLD
jgi:hypothetical protein